MRYQENTQRDEPRSKPKALFTSKRAAALKGLSITTGRGSQNAATEEMALARDLFSTPSGLQLTSVGGPSPGVRPRLNSLNSLTLKNHLAAIKISNASQERLGEAAQLSPTGKAKRLPLFPTGEIQTPAVVRKAGVLEKAFNTAARPDRASDYSNPFSPGLPGTSTCASPGASAAARSRAQRGAGAQKRKDNMIDPFEAPAVEENKMLIQKRVKGHLDAMRAALGRNGRGQ